MKQRYEEISYGGQTYRVRRPLGRVESARREEGGARGGARTAGHTDTYQAEARHPLAWAALAAASLCALIACGLFVAPQLLGIHLQTMPNMAFVNGSILTYDEGAARQVYALKNTLDTERIFPGITVDGIALDGLTVEEARVALQLIEPAGGGDFAVTIRIADKGWLIDTNQVPISRNLEETVWKAYAYGRQNSPALRGSGLTPAQERAQAVNALRVNPVRMETCLSYDQRLVRSLTDQIAAQMSEPAVSAAVAGFDLNTKTFSFIDDIPGTRVDPEALYRAVIDRIGSDPYGTVTMQPETVVADMTKAELMNSLRRISSYSTATTSNANRNTNIRLSCEAINGMVVEAGDTFSFNRATGQRTAAKGYREATAISGGQSIPEVGGGVCQTSSTLFNAVARANLELVTRSPHAWPSSYVEKGMDATVNWPGLDFQFRNNTDWPIYIMAWYENRKVYVELYGMTLGDGVTIDLESKVTRTLPAPSGVKEVQNPELPHGTRKTTVQARKGYEVETWQVWYRAGKEIDRRLLCTSTYRAYQETVEWN